MTAPLMIEGQSIEALKQLPPEELDILLGFGRPITFRIGSAEILAEFNRIDGDELSINLAHIDGGGEGVLVALLKLAEGYASERRYHSIHWHVHALTCARPNPRLQRFLRANGFAEIEHPQHGRVLTRRQPLRIAGSP